MIVLQPFAETSLSTQVLVLAERKAGELIVNFTLSGDLDSLVIPSAKDVPMRRDGLWGNTCFECFFAPVGKSEYWEMNFSPSGDWNCYSFADYRQGMQEDPAVKVLPVQLGGHGDVLTVSVSFSLPSSVATTDIEVGLCAVVKEKTGKMSYWAFRHPADQPDFHDRRSFGVTL